MKKITFAAVAVLTLFIAGCSQKSTAAESKQEQKTEQVETKQSSSIEETSSKGVDLKHAPTTLNGDEDYMAVIAYRFQKVVKRKIGKVYYYDNTLVVKLNLSREDLDKDDVQDFVDSLHDLKVAVLDLYNSDYNSHKQAQLEVYDTNAKEVAHQKGVDMVLDY